MKQIHYALTVWMCIASMRINSMEISKTLAPHNPETAAVHEQSLRGFKRSNTRHMQVLRDAIEYFETTDHPNRALWLRQCEAAKYLIQHYVPKIQRKFQTLLALEQEQPDSSRWTKIQKVLPLDTSIALHADNELMQKLISLAHDAQPTHEKWVHIIKPERKQPQELLKEQVDPVDEENDDKEEEIAEENKQPELVEKQLQQQKKLNQKKYVPTKANKNKKKKNKKKKKKTGIPTKSPSSALPEKPLISQKTVLTHELWQALAKRDAQQLSTVLAAGTHLIDVNQRHSTHNMTPLHLAIAQDDPVSSEMLLKNGALTSAAHWVPMPNIQDQIKFSPLAFAVNQGSLRCASLLLHYKADPNEPLLYKRSKNVEHVLCLAAKMIDFEKKKLTPQAQEQMIRLLLKNGATAFCGKVILFDLERQKNWLINLTNAEHKALLPNLLTFTTQIFCKNGNICLIANSQAISTIESLGLESAPCTVTNVTRSLWHALEQEDLAQMQELLTLHKDSIFLDAPHKEHNNFGMLHYCVRQNNAELCQLLLEHGADPDAVVNVTLKSANKGTLQATPLILAITCASVDRARQLLMHGANPNKIVTHMPEGLEESPLDCAAILHAQNNEYTPEIQKVMVKLLLQSGADAFSGTVSLVDPKKQKALLLNLKNKEDQVIIQYVLSREESQHCILCPDGNIVLVYETEATNMAQDSVILEEEELFDEPVVSREQPSDQFWNLLIANKLAEAQELIKTYPHVTNITISCNNTKQLSPLGYAISENNEKMCNMLLDHQANPNIPCILILPENYEKLRLTPLTLAASLGFIERARELLQHGADPNIPAVYLESHAQEHPLALVICPAKNATKQFPASRRLEMFKLLLEYGAHDHTCHTFFYNMTSTCGYKLDLAHKQHQALLRLILKDTIAVDFKENSYILVGITLDEQVTKKLTPFAIIDPDSAQQKKDKE